MIRKNVQVGNKENVTIVELGKGDVCISSLINHEEKYIAIGFTQIDKTPIGTTVFDKDQTTDEVGIDVMIHVTEIKSLYVLANKIQDAMLAFANPGLNGETPIQVKEIIE